MVEKRFLFRFAGSVSKGKEGKADASIIINDTDLVDMAMGKLKPQECNFECCQIIYNYLIG